MALDYIAFSIQMAETANPENIIAELNAIGFDGFWEQDSALMAYVPEATYNSQFRKEVDAFCQQQGLQCKWSELPDQNWNKSWESNFQPVTVRNQCLVRAPFHQPGPEFKYEIIIEPQMSFGTGHHETTSMMIDLIMDLPLKGKNILDMGTGTGILAILARMMGAKDILAVDNDEWAYKNTLNNINWNKIQGFDVVLGDILSIKNQKFDIIIANINRNILLKDIVYYADALNAGGQLLMSGFYSKDLESINEVASSSGLAREKSIASNDWTAVQYIKRTE